MKLILQKVCGQPAALCVELRRCGPADAAAFYALQNEVRAVMPHPEQFVPDTLENIGAEAFANCETLESITIPENVRTIGENAFSGTHPKFTLRCKRLSAAEQYARENNIPFQLIV